MALPTSTNRIRSPRRVSPSKQRARDAVQWALAHPEEMQERFALQPDQSSQPERQDLQPQPQPEAEAPQPQR